MNATQHFRASLCATVTELIDAVGAHLGGVDVALREFPFLAGWQEDAAELPPSWRTHAGIVAAEAAVEAHLPVRSLCDTAAIGPERRAPYLCLGLIEEDARFGILFEAIQSTPGQHRPTAGLLHTLWPESGRATARRVLAAGLARATDRSAPRSEQPLEIPGPLWDALRGDVDSAGLPHAPGLRLHPRRGATPLGDLALPEEIRARAAAFSPRGHETIVVRGPAHNGRSALLAAMARAQGRPILFLEPPFDDARWREVGPMAAALGAWPVAVVDAAPGETVRVRRPAPWTGTVGVVLGSAGGVAVDDDEATQSFTLPMPDAALRERLWARHAPDHAANLAAGARLPAGHIARLGERLGRRGAVDPAAVRDATRGVRREQLETLATPVPTVAGWAALRLPAAVQRELDLLERRCREREKLRGRLGPALSDLSFGVKALLHGPSGTGKTLAVRALAGALHKDLYRLDLATVVDKYIGETEKNLARILARAEELDVVLLLDEGDALLARRTAVGSANDRYANIEVNYLLQRLETYDGILVVTTNGRDRIDPAFERRMDVVVEITLPDAEERRGIWLLHLPSEHQLGDAFLTEVSLRCRLTGGVIRNAALHAALLAAEADAPITEEALFLAIEREYRKSGAPCPLPRPRGTG
jgi:hypothetical protein